MTEHPQKAAIAEAVVRFHLDSERLTSALERLSGTDSKNTRKSARLALASVRIALAEVATLTKEPGDA